LAFANDIVPVLYREVAEVQHIAMDIAIAEDFKEILGSLSRAGNVAPARQQSML